MAKKKIAIVGAGAVGGYAGAHMVQAGEDVTYIDPWPENVEAIRKDGLRITHIRDVEPFTVKPRALHLTEAQRASFTALQDTNAKAEETLKNACQADDALTPPGRLAAVGKRLDVMLQAVKTVRTALDDFYGKLTDEQKAQFEAIGPARVTLSSQAAVSQRATPTHHRRRHHARIPGIIRHFMAFGW